jgi:hypothetical protein
MNERMFVEVAGTFCRGMDVADKQVEPLTTASLLV